ncbi:MAG: bifunctional diaminohydroxyphosphoribosylaminopyrimidine deaminase/5-amino-6-(5-phosphoribosylamino)uracil reductase RibD [Proteobacteria bacterium]|nr:bifunctional diaminohydroxyphosphoribosylaminopyrimidine deaminase/5-amino-6-(5-phosphoribosylamino)uracil reductase RibD [Pseudomonadota bacterium]
MLTDVDKLYLTTAFALAERGMYTTSPNPRVGCVLVRDGKVLGRGWHIRTGHGHAEANALANAAANGVADVSGATAYVSLEPCAFHGRTPSCARTLVEQHITRVVLGGLDPHPKVSGEGVRILTDAGIKVDVAPDDLNVDLNPGQRVRFTQARPYVRLKIAASIDGRTAMASGESQWITSAPARADVQSFRARSCAVITGNGTLKADNPTLNVRDDAYAVDGYLRQPLRVVVASDGDVSGATNLLAAPGPVLVAHTASRVKKTVKIKREGLEWVACGEAQIDLKTLLAHLAERDCNEVLVEAGPRLTGSFLDQGLWDEVVLYQAPVLLGVSARALGAFDRSTLADAVRGELLDSVMVGPDLRVRLRAIR